MGLPLSEAGQEFLRLLSRELGLLRAEADQEKERARTGPPMYGLLEHHNLAHYRNSECAWTMNRNNMFPWWRLG